MSASNSRLSIAPKNRKRYNSPSLTKLTPEEAKNALEEKGIPDDENVQKLIEAAKLRLGEEN